MSDGGKGSKQRPTNYEAYATAWDRIFKKGSLSSTQDAPNVAPVMPEPSTVTAAPTVLNVKPTPESKVNQ